MSKGNLEKSKKAVLLGFAGGGALMVFNAPVAALAWFFFFFGQGLRLAQKERQKSSLLRATEEIDSRTLETEEQESQKDAKKGFSGDGDELLAAGIEMRERKATLNGHPLYLYAIKGGEVYEFDGIACQKGLEAGLLVINGARYVKASPKRALKEMK